MYIIPELVLSANNSLCILYLNLCYLSVLSKYIIPELAKVLTKIMPEGLLDRQF